ncbi:MAG: N-acetylmuramoyl-L-alanine amidase [Verrucomicrobiales bacterium]|jgi:N-acetylmuramoyl-L-alanine amidase
MGFFKHTFERAMDLAQTRWIKLSRYAWGLMLSLLFLYAGAEHAAAFRVVLDPGHGGRDNGTRWAGVREKDLNLDVAKRVERILRSKGVSTYLTRRSDYYLSLSTRATRANRYRDSVYVSIHFNAANARSATGIETFYLSNNGRRLGYQIQNRLVSRLGTKNRGLKKRGFAVLRKTRGPAVLVECGFLSNSWERARCKSSSYRQKVAQAIADGIVYYRKRYS